jgi:hypothetical protein
MASDRGWYLIAVGVLALGLSNTLVNSHPNWLGSLTDRSVVTAERLSGQAERYLAMAQIMLGRSEAGFGSTQAILGRLQAHLGEVQANLSRRQAEMARVEVENVGMVSLPPMPSIRVACPRVRVRVAQPVVMAASQ